QRRAVIETVSPDPVVGARAARLGDASWPRARPRHPFEQAFLVEPDDAVLAPEGAGTRARGNRARPVQQCLAAVWSPESPDPKRAGSLVPVQQALTVECQEGVIPRCGGVWVLPEAGGPLSALELAPQLVSLRRAAGARGEQAPIRGARIVEERARLLSGAAGRHRHQTRRGDVELRPLNRLQSRQGLGLEAAVRAHRPDVVMRA